jgi:hypothetical protein
MILFEDSYFVSSNFHQYDPLSLKFVSNLEGCLFKHHQFGIMGIILNYVINSSCFNLELLTKENKIIQHDARTCFCRLI